MGKRQQQILQMRFIGYLIFVLVIVVSSVSANVIGKKDQESSEDTPGLYNTSDTVYILDNINFKTSVLHSKRAWLVEFYNSWCGFCHRFAPIWKAVAKSVDGWKDVVRIAAIDCAKDDNNPICREYEVMRYPLLKFFPVNAQSDFLGLEIQKSRDEESITQSLLEQLEKEQQEQRGGPNWPNLAPYRNNNIETLWHGVPRNVKIQFLIFEEPNQYLGSAVILDLHKLPSVRIRRVTSENVLTVMSKVTKYPSIVAIQQDKPQTILKVDKSTREGLREAILQYLKSPEISIETLEFLERFEQIFKDGPLLIKNYPSKEAYMDAVEEKISLISMENNIHRAKDKLYQLDLETAVRYTLNNEIPLSHMIDGEKFIALRTYLRVLAHYFPAHLPKMKTYLHILRSVVESKNEISGKEFRTEVKTKEAGLRPIYSGQKAWIGCKGSDPTFRGYPCGLWTLFHTLTVAAADDIHDDKSGYNQSIVLSAMHGYVKYFFGCANCSEHFQEMARKRNLFEVRGTDESILWLWRAHNEVNERLAGDETEDPKHKKIQYPPPDHCPQCKLSDGKWNENEVLSYLKKKYSRSNIDFEDVNDQIVQQEKIISASSSGVSHRKIGWDFTIFDISICVVLYIVSAAILTLVCIKFAYKRSHKKKLAYQA